MSVNDCFQTKPPTWTGLRSLYLAEAELEATPPKGGVGQVLFCLPLGGGRLERACVGVPFLLYACPLTSIRFMLSHYRQHSSVRLERVHFHQQVKARSMPNNISPENSPFRSWFRDCLKSLPGNTVEWPFLVRQILAEELLRLRTSDQFYAGDIFRNRDERVHTHRSRVSEDEEILVYKLYSAVHELHQGILQIGDTKVWLFTLQVPNQGKLHSSQTKGRRADLLGLKEDGSLVLFEVKGPRNRQDSPLYGILEGLDYLGCLLTPRNLTRLNDGLQEWIIDQESKEKNSGQFSSIIPDWPKLSIDPQGNHTVIVLAPRSYFDLHHTDSHGRSLDWWCLSDRSTAVVETEPRISLEFSIVDFEQGTAAWFDSTAAPSEARQAIEDPVGPEAAVRLPRDLIWFDGQSDIPVTRVRYGRIHTRIQLSDGEKTLVLTNQLRPALPNNPAP